MLKVEKLVKQEKVESETPKKSKHSAKNEEPAEQTKATLLLNRGKVVVGRNIKTEVLRSSCNSFSRGNVHNTAMHTACRE